MAFTTGLNLRVTGNREDKTRKADTLHGDL
jgi:hypothetical protein